MRTLEDEGLLTTTKRTERWLSLLEQELKHRVGWADEAISPFARKDRIAQISVDVPRAA